MRGEIRPMETVETPHHHYSSEIRTPTQQSSGRSPAQEEDDPLEGSVRAKTKQLWMPVRIRMKVARALLIPSQEDPLQGPSALIVRSSRWM